MQDTPKPLKKGYKFPIYPNAAQRTQLEKTFGCCRYVYNRALAESRETYAAYNELLSKGVINPKDRPQVDGYYFVDRITDYKRDEESLWLKEVSNIALQQSMLHLGAAYTRFFRERKGFPRFKKKQSAQSFSLMRNGFTLVGNQLRLAKTDGLIKVALSRELPSEPSSLTISRTSTCKYYVSFTCEYTPKKTKGQGVIGLDAGISALITTSVVEKIMKGLKWEYRTGETIQADIYGCRIVHELRPGVLHATPFWGEIFFTDVEKEPVQVDSLECFVAFILARYW